MNIILVTTLVIMGIGLVVGAGLVYAGKKFAVKVDEREIAVLEREEQQGSFEYTPEEQDSLLQLWYKNTLATDFDAVNEYNMDSVPVGGAPVAQAIGDIMGASAEAQERKVAFVACKGTCDVTKNQGNYIGIQDCRAAVLCGMNVSDCIYGCLGFGSCAEVCPEQAISIQNGVAVVNRKRCVSCGLCAKTCPRGLISLIPESRIIRVQCSNRDKGPVVRKMCSAGCIGCTLCVRQCENDAIHVADNLAHVDYDACIQCGKCVEKCPAKVITPPAGTGA